MSDYRKLADDIMFAVERSSAGRRVALAFSGSLNSGLMSYLADRFAESVRLHRCGSEESFDVLAAEELSSKIGLPQMHVPISIDTIEDDLMELITAICTEDLFILSYKLQLFCVCRAATEGTLITGQGANEYFVGCANYVGCTDNDYDAYVKDVVRKLMDLSVPCELRIAWHFGKELVYPYLDERVLECVGGSTPPNLGRGKWTPRRRSSRKSRQDLGYPYLTCRTKKSSQYESSTTDIVRVLAKCNGMMYNRYIAHLCSHIFLKAGDSMDQTRLDT